QHRRRADGPRARRNAGGRLHRLRQQRGAGTAAQTRTAVEHDGTGGCPMSERTSTAVRNGSTAPARARRAPSAPEEMSAGSRYLHGWLVFLGLLIAWEVATRLAGSAFFPPPTAILAAAREQWLSGPAAALFLTDTAINDVLGSLGR